MGNSKSSRGFLKKSGKRLKKRVRNYTFKQSVVLQRSKEVQLFIEIIRNQCRRCKVSLILANSSSLGKQGGGDLLGFFQQPGRGRGMIKVATRNIPIEDWILTLAHEYAHFLQWFNNDPIYNLSDKQYIELEIETEKQTSKLLKRFRIPLSQDYFNLKSKMYIQRLKKNAL